MTPMPNIAHLLKQEIVRLARKEVRAEVAALKKASALYRSEIAELKKQQQALELEVKRLNKAAQRPATVPDDAPPATAGRFSAKAFAAQRQKLGLSAREVAQLLGVSELSVYKWESGKVQPRAQYLPALNEFKALGKREATARLAQSS